MDNFKTVLDLGSKNLRLAVFDQNSKNIYSSKEIIIDNLEKSLNVLIRNAEKSLSMHIENVVVLYDTPKFNSLDLSIKKIFDHEVPFKKVYNDLLEEANFIISQNNFKNKIIHSVVNNIIVDENKTIEQISDNIKIKSLIIEIKLICLNKTIINDISNILKKNNLKIINLYCSSYVKTFTYKKKFDNEDFIAFLDIGYERSSGLVFNNNKFKFLNSISIGSNNITKDISKILKLDLDYSESLKIKFNSKENNVSSNKIGIKNNIYSEILQKNISIDLVKQIIEARLEEIIELAVCPNNQVKNLNSNEKLKLILIGSGSKLISNIYEFKNLERLLEITLFDETEFMVCEAGFKYHRSEESFLQQTKEKVRKYGFFENFFNLFSK